MTTTFSLKEPCWSPTWLPLDLNLQRLHQKWLRSTPSLPYNEPFLLQFQLLCSCLADRAKRRPPSTLMPWTSSREEAMVSFFLLWTCPAAEYSQGMGRKGWKHPQGSGCFARKVQGQLRSNSWNLQGWCSDQWGCLGEPPRWQLQVLIISFGIQYLVLDPKKKKKGCGILCFGFSQAS